MAFPDDQDRQLHSVRKCLLSSLVGENICPDSILLSLSLWILPNSWIHQIHDPWLTHSLYEHGSGFHDKVPWSQDNYLPKVSDGEPRYKQTPKLLTFITLKSIQWKSSPHQIRNVSQDFSVACKGHITAYLQDKVWWMLNLHSVGSSTMDHISIRDNGKLIILSHKL